VPCCQEVKQKCAMLSRSEAGVPCCQEVKQKCVMLSRSEAEVCHAVKK
jgi:hypothetical protein